MKAVFLDRDGVINFERESYIKSPDEFEFIPNSIKALKMLSEAGFKLVIITNQSGIAKGLYSETDLENIHKKMLTELSKQNIKIDEIKYCPHDEASKCKCRKPEPKMVLSAAEKLNIDLNKSWLVGDRLRDIATAEKLKEMGYKIKSILVMTGRAGSDKEFNVVPDFRAKDLFEATNIILNVSNNEKI